MRTLFFLLLAALLSLSVMIISAGAKGIGEKCYSDIECGFGAECTDGVCTKKKEFDHGSSGKTGKPCNIDADCIGSGKCVEGRFGRKYCSGD